MKELISRKDAARMLGISVKTLDKARIDGLIAYVQFTGNGCVFFTEAALEEYVAKKTHRSKPAEKPKETFRRKRV